MWVRDAAGKVTRYDHRLTSTLTRVQGPGDPSDPNDPRYTTVSGPVRTWVYEPTTNRLTSETHPEAGTTRYSVYNGLGQPTEIRRLRPGQADEVTQLTYDTENRLTRRETIGTGYFATAAYDRFGRVWQTANQDVTTTFAFDDAGRLEKRTDQIAGRDFVSELKYDSADRLQTLFYPNPAKRRIDYTYAAGRLASISNNQNTVPFASLFSYDAQSGALTSFTTGNVTQQLQADAQFRPTRLWTTGLQQGNDLDLTLNYTRAGDIAGVTDTRSPTAQSYSYDVLHRLTQAVGPWGTLAFEYDATGNRTRETRNGVSTLYSYDAGTNRLLSAGPPQEAFSYDAFGRQVSDGRATYTYTPSDAVATATGTGVAAAFTYDSDNLRVRSVVNGAERYSIRGPGGQVLTEYENRCGTLVWQRDLVYGAGRLLGAVKNGSPAPTVAFSVASVSVSEAAPGGRYQAAIQLSTLTPLPCALTVSYQTSNGTALVGEDYSAARGTVTFAPGSVNGALQTVDVPILEDAVYEGAETFFVSLSSPTGGVLGPVSSQQVTITDNETVPVLAINDVTTAEGAGTASFTVTVTPVSAQPITVTFATANETAIAGQDYTARAEVLTIPVRTASMPIPVSILEDALPEYAETFTLTLSAPVNATLGRAVGRATITDNDRVPIDLSLGGQFLADLNAGPTASDWLLVSNPYGAPITARLTWLRPDGTGVRRDIALAARQRITIPVSSEPGIAGQGEVSVAVQSITPGLPGIDVEHSQYWADWHAGRSTEGVTPAPTWYLAEGATTAFNEWITVFNPADVPVIVQFDFYGVNGLLYTRGEYIPQGPGRFKVPLRDWIGGVDHGTRIQATTAGGQPTPIVVERTMSWNWGSAPEGHSTPGVSALSPAWYFAEGENSFFATYLALLNPSATPSTVRVWYVHENGQRYPQDLVVGAGRRATATPPSAVPAGSFGIEVQVLSGSPVAAERMLYGNPNWDLGHAGVGAPATASTWRFSEGSSSSYFTTYFLLMNPTATPTTATLTFTLATGTVVTSSVAVPPTARTSVLVNGIPGMSNAEFRTVVSTNNGVGLVVERATYWPGTTSQSLAAGTLSLTTTDAVADGAATKELADGTEALRPQTVVVDPYRQPGVRRIAPLLYEALIGAEEGAAGVDGDLRAGATGLSVVSPDTGPPLPSKSLAGAEPLAATTVTVPWYGATLTGGRRQ